MSESTQDPAAEATPGAAAPRVEAAKGAPTEPAWAARLGQLLGSARRWGVLATLIAVAPAWLLWPLTHRPKNDYLLRNDLSLADQAQILRWMAVAALLVGSLYLWWLRRAMRAGQALDDAGRQLNATLCWLLALAAFPILQVQGVEAEHPFFTMAVITLMTAFATRSFFEVGKHPPGVLVQAMARTRTVLPAALLGVAMVAYAWVLSSWSIMDHHAMTSGIYDLGIYENIVWQSAHGRLLDCSFIKSGSHVSAHVDPILVLLAPFYLVAPQAETLLIFQSVWLALGATPLYLLCARRFENPWLGLALGLAYLLQPALHGMNLYMFHSLTLAGPLLLWAIYTLECKRRRAYWVVLALLLLTREDMSFLACFIGLYAMLAGEIRKGLLTIGIALVYFVCIKMFVMVDSSIFMEGSKEAYGYASVYGELIQHESSGARGLAYSVGSNPQFVLKLVTIEKKVLFLAMMVLPVIGLPLLAGRRRILLGYGLLFILLASKEPVYTAGFQYSAVFFPFLLALTPFGIERLAELDARVGEGRRRPIWVAGTLAVLLCSGLISYKYGGFIANEGFRAGFGNRARSTPEEVVRRYEWMRAAIDEHIPDDAAVSATKHPGAHVAGRRGAYHFPKHSDPDFLLIYQRDIRKSEDQQKTLAELVSSGEFELVDEFDGMEIYRRTR